MLIRLLGSRRDYKKTAADLVAGRYEFGIKPHEADARSVARPYSELSYRDRELKKLLHSTSQIPRNLHQSASDEKTEVGAASHIH